MPIYIKPLIVVADAEHARFVRPEQEDNTLHSYSRANPAEGHVGEANKRHAMSPTDLPDWVAKQLDAEIASYDELYIVAPAKVLGEIRHHLTKPVTAKLKDTLDKDLTKISDHDLQSHFTHWVRPVHRAS